uniref:Putative ovule protein n=1 Tax=Solanum chacoense TaxID=4108 RepID=A0A0V0GVT7_SOLCH
MILHFLYPKFQTTCSPQIQTKDTFNHPKHTHTHLYQSISINPICLVGYTNLFRLLGHMCVRI